jgi:hypothetical protein
MTAQRLVRLAPVVLLAAGLAGLLAAILAAQGDDATPGPRPEATPELACVEGELAENPVERGRVQERLEEFATIEEAEAFICHRIAYPRNTAGMTLQRIRAKRSNSLAQTLEGSGDAYIILDYAGSNPDYYILARIASLPFTDITRGPRDEDLFVQRVEGFLRHGGREGNVVANWQKDGLYFGMTTQLHDDFTLGNFLEVLESVR